MSNTPTSEIAELLTRYHALMASKTIVAERNELDALMLMVQTLLPKYPDRRRELGPLLGELSKRQQAIHAYPLKWLEVSGGSLAIGHRPKIKMINVMPMLGVTHVLTLQSVSEKANTIGKHVKQADMTWLWFEMESAKPPSPEKTKTLLSVFNEMQLALSQGAKIYIHCAAGIHRTGMIAYALLRYLGMSESDAMQGLAQMRQETALGVGEERIDWVNQLLGRGI